MICEDDIKLYQVERSDGFRSDGMRSPRVHHNDQATPQATKEAAHPITPPHNTFPSSAICYRVWQKGFPTIQAKATEEMVQPVHDMQGKRWRQTDPLSLESDMPQTLLPKTLALQESFFL